MRLKCIKLAGFKSFIDFTTVVFPTNLSAVVGPNGCGKSNIIDAVRWVMGESSAKNLRGESMTDVIFNGSKQRKPVAQAFVELIFDNSDGTIIGEYAGYNEISVKRLVTRDGKNHYFLNAGRCRRRDIMDIFLGTGLGPRSYAIISQGIISNLIESKPEELRVFIEEAAGISKYKERRRETENRLRRTKDNIERLTDIREELTRRLAHLKTQAETAARYKALKEQEKFKKAQLMALKWQRLTTSVEQQQGEIQHMEVALEGELATLRGLEADHEKMRCEEQGCHDNYNKIQGDFYQLGNDVSRIEQTIAHRQERAVQLRDDLAEIEKNRQVSSQILEKDSAVLTELSGQLTQVQPLMEAISAQHRKASEIVEQCRGSLQNWQQRWDAFTEQAMKPQRVAEVERSKIAHMEQVVGQVTVRQGRLQQELATLTTTSKNGNLRDAEEHALLLEQIEDLQIQVEGLRGTMEQQRQCVVQGQKKLDLLRQSLNTKSGTHASLEALQKAAVGHQEAVRVWLEKTHLNHKAQLVEKITVRSGWEKAVEAILGDDLQAICVESLEPVVAALENLNVGSVTFLQSTMCQEEQKVRGSKAPLLSSYLDSEIPISDKLMGVYTAPNLEQALALRPQLTAGESVVTATGICVSPQALRVYQQDDQQGTVLARQQSLQALSAQLGVIKEQIRTQEQHLLEDESALKNTEENWTQNQQKLAKLHAQQGDLKATLATEHAKKEQAILHAQHIRAELEEIAEQVCIEYERIADARICLQEALDSMAEYDKERAVLRAERQSLQDAQERANKELTSLQMQQHDLALQQQKLVTEKTAIIQASERIKTQMQSLDDRKRSIEGQLDAESDSALSFLQEELEEKLKARLVIEEQLQCAKKQLQMVQAQTSALEKDRHGKEHALSTLRQKLEEKRLDLQKSQVMRTALNDQLLEAQCDLKTLLKTLSEELEIAYLEEEIIALADLIQKLGAINLAAIKEYDLEFQRSEYLEHQDKDLHSALTTLEGAIGRIDEETCRRFKSTFDRVNEGLANLFPKVFGGGHAKLHLLGESLLDTGVRIMAQPPGKKNSTIHLLSGGEKALVAISLVFSIFQLNPAPFCLLDEVDAPLDDVNVVRYTQLVKEMSDKVQFIFITHNKIAMQVANQLIGVTMPEPGVSKLVTVDVDEATKLAAC